jgi:hypothetical protein
VKEGITILSLQRIQFFRSIVAAVLRFYTSDYLLNAAKCITYIDRHLQLHFMLKIIITCICIELTVKM